MEFIVTPEESGQKLLKILLRKTDGTKVFLFKLFRKGLITVNGTSEAHTYIVREGDKIYARNLLEHRSDVKFQSAKTDISILFEDDDILAVDKPSGIAVHAAQGIRQQDTLLEMVRAYLHRDGKTHSFIAPVHRLDRNTAGVVIFAKNYQAAKDISEAFQEGNVTKVYQALLSGRLEKQIFISADIVRLEEENRVQAKNVAISDTIPDKKEWLMTEYARSKTVSGTIISPLETTPAGTRAEITIWTGRHHQIRAACEAAGHPVVDDRKYGQGKGEQKLLCKKIVLENRGIAIESKQAI